VCLISDSRGRVVHVSGKLPEAAQALTPEMVTQIALGKSETHVQLTEGLVMVWNSVPLKEDGRIWGAVSLGLELGREKLDALGRKLGLGISLAGPSGILASSFASGPALSPDLDTIRRVLADPAPAYIENHDLGLALFLTQSRLVDQSVALVLQFDITESYRPLSESSHRLFWSAAVILGLVLLLGIATYHFLINPLRRLFHKSQVLLEVCAKSADGAPPIHAGTFDVGNEIRILDQALETASLTVYAYICKLHDQRERFKTMAVKDPLTGLGNRRLFDDLLPAALSLCQRHGGRLAVLFLDLDRFKPVNDTLGHDVGDALLKEVGARMGLSLRASDAVFRLGGDEFAALLPECADADMALALAERLRESVSRPYILKGHECRIGVSIGIAMYPIHGTDMTDLLKRADSALYRAKEAGRGCCMLHQP
ncbi:MAG: GGDEF domain-containing protein, partial [Magnetococcales bacterium]|nr:GGDEF domain-containing protein [Magnetococcales bacterium]